MIQKILKDYYVHVGISIVNDMEGLEQLVAKKPDLVFLGLKRLPQDAAPKLSPAEDVWISEYLDSKGVNYTGSTRVAIELDFNKESAKIKVNQAGLPTAEFFTALPGQHKDKLDLPLRFPLFVKPLDAGGGKGIGNDSVVTNFYEFQRKVRSIFNELGSGSLVESYLTGREFSVAVLDSGDQELIVMPVELIAQEDANGHRILGSQVKTNDTERVVAVEDAQVHSMISLLAKDIYLTLGARDLGRIDIRMDGAGDAYFLEANFVPGLKGYFRRACLINEGMDYKNLILNITELGLARNAEKSLVIR